MRKLDFLLNDFTRISWASREARSTWEPRISAIVKAWEKIERLRPAALQMIDPTDLPRVSSELSNTHKIALPLQMQGVTETYSATSEPFNPNKKWSYRIAICNPFTASEWVVAWQKQDNNAIGRLLGYPRCCREFFERVWGPYVDTTWHMALNTDGASRIDDLISIPANHIQSNILLRWLGVRLVSHLPCSFSCDYSDAIARKNMDLAANNGFEQEMSWIIDMLSWPVEWSALHGIAEIKTPILKISTRTDSTPVKYMVHKLGNGYPMDGARGNSFPYRKGLPKVDDMWTDNGFSSLGAMKEAHDVLVPVIPTGLRNVLDLGCGNGILLSRIDCENRYGIDRRDSAVRAARAHIHTDTFKQGLIGEDLPWDVDFDLILLMVGRVRELNEEDRVKLFTMLRHRTKYLLLYAYGDWLENISIYTLIAQAGFSFDNWRQITSGAQKHSACVLLEKR